MTNLTPLNPDALAQLIMWKELPYGGDPDTYIRLDANAAHKVIELLKPHLAVTQPEVNSVEELDQLPVESVVRDSAGLVYENDLFDQKQDYKWARMASGGNYPTRAIDLPARVLYRPTKEYTNGR